MKVVRNWFKSLCRLFYLEDGNIDLGGLILLGVGMIFVAVGFILFQVVMGGAGEVLRYSERTTAYNVTVDNFTGLKATTQVGPLIIFVGFLAGGVISGFFGIKQLIRSGG